MKNLKKVKSIEDAVLVEGVPTLYLTEDGECINPIPKPKSYVQDGLIFQLDCEEGIEELEGRKIWRDQKSNIPWYIHRGDVTDEGFIGGAHIEGGSSIILGDTFTFEVVFKPSKEQSSSYFGFDVLSCQISVGTNGTMNIVGGKKNGIGFHILKNVEEEVSTLQFSNNELMLNLVPFDNQEDWYNNNIAIDYEFPLYSVRIYNRELSEQEKRNNYLIDIEKYGA